MCPLRFILVFFSAILAGYCAWRAVHSSPGTGIISQDYATEENIPSEKQEYKLKMMLQNGLWVFVDMASGKYLWRNLKELNKTK